MRAATGAHRTASRPWLAARVLGDCCEPGTARGPVVVSRCAHSPREPGTAKWGCRVTRCHGYKGAGAPRHATLHRYSDITFRLMGRPPGPSRWSHAMRLGCAPYPLRIHTVDNIVIYGVYTEGVGSASEAPPRRIAWEWLAKAPWTSGQSRRKPARYCRGLPRVAALRIRWPVQPQASSGLR